jgi:pimeloyl-ACP methyl ester carboxylesterase
MTQTKSVQRKTPIALTVLRGGLRAISTLSTPCAGRLANKLWFKPQRYPEPQRERQWLESADWQIVPFQEHALQTYCWGTNGPQVLLLHGWDGRGGQLGGFVKPLLEKGYRVITFDAPAHGRTGGKRTDLPTITQAIHTLAAHYGAFDSIIAHSFGGLCAANALHTGLSISSMVFIAAPLGATTTVERFADILQLKPKVVNEHRRLVEKQFGQDIWERFSMSNLTKDLAIPGLIIHDENDNDLPASHGEEIARSWPNCEFHLTSGLGHRRILRNAGVIERIVSFISHA